MFKESIIILDIIALLLTAIWILRSVIIGLTAADLIFNYIYSIVVFIGYSLTLIEKFYNNGED